jgi:glycosyltransferase involved in cell wall biosynthesis
MRIIFLSYAFWPPDFGGEHLITAERGEELVQRGHEFTVLTSGRPGFPARATLNGLKVLRSPMIHESRAGRLLRRLIFIPWAMLQMLVLSFDILHLGSLPLGGKAAYSLVGGLFSLVAHIRRARVVVVCSLAEREDAAVDLGGFSGRLMAIYLGCMDKIVGVSVALYEALKEHFSAQAAYIHNGIRDDLFVPLAAARRFEVRRQAGLRGDETVFIFMGSVDFRKGFDVLAQAFAHLSRKYSYWRLWVVGPYTRQHSQNTNPEEVERVRAPLNGNTAVKFWGRLDDRPRLADLMAAADVFVFPTRREGMPLSPIEAMSCGLPLIISRLPGSTDMINAEGQTGFYVTPGNLEELRQAMEKLGTDQTLRQKLGSQARARVVETLGWQQHLDQWEALYQSCLS